jgi:micrococcal nuclease
MLTLASFALVLALALGAGAYAVTRVDVLVSRAVLVVAALGLAAGGVAAQTAPIAPAEPTATGSDRAPEATVPVASGDRSAAPERLVATDAVTAANGSGSNATTATVVGVSGGDWITYRTAAGDRRTVRLAGLDAPGVGGADPGRFEGVLTGSRGRTCLAEQGRRALLDVRSSLVGESVTVRSVTEGSGAPRAVLTVGGQSINRRLVDQGYARRSAASPGRNGRPGAPNVASGRVRPSPRRPRFGSPRSRASASRPFTPTHRVTTRRRSPTSISSSKTPAK